jgi:hypothetical protein
MKIILVLIGIILALWVSRFVYMLWLRPIDQLTPEMRQMEQHFNRLGIGGHFYPVRHTFNHSRVQAVSAFEIKDYPLPFGLVACTTDAEAIALSAHDPHYPEPLQPIRKGLFVLDFSGWGNDTFQMAQSVRQAFQSYRAEP